MDDEPLALTPEECDLILSIRREQLRRDQCQEHDDNATPMTAHEFEVNERAERGLMSNAEAHRLVEEAMQMRRERDEARAEIERLHRDCVHERHYRVVTEQRDALAERVEALLAERDALRAAGEALATMLPDFVQALENAGESVGGPIWLPVGASAWVAARAALDRWRALVRDGAAGEGR